MILTKLDNFLLYLLSKTRKESFDDGINSLFFFLYLPGVILFAFGLLFVFYLVCFVAFESFFVRNFNAEDSFKGYFLSAFILGSILLLLSAFVRIRLEKVIEEHAESHVSNFKAKEFYGVGLDTNLIIYPKYGIADKDIQISTQKPFSYQEMKKLENRKVTIKILKGNEYSFVSGGKTQILLKNEEEIAKLEVPERALVYKIEEVWRIQENVKKTCGPARDTSENIYTKIFLVASVDENKVKNLKDRSELDALLRF